MEGVTEEVEAIVMPAQYNLHGGMLAASPSS